MTQFTTGQAWLQWNAKPFPDIAPAAAVHMPSRDDWLYSADLFESFKTESPAKQGSLLHHACSRPSSEVTPAPVASDAKC